MPVADRLALAEAIWKTLAGDEANVQVPPTNAEIVAERLAADLGADDPGEDFAALRRRLEGRS